MGRTCRGICIYSKGVPMSNGKRYENGQKRCSYCGLFLETSEVRCPCCKTILRVKSRSKNQKSDMYD
jgi:hydrogenase nickel incorporation protein HypA/HybF